MLIQDSTTITATPIKDTIFVPLYLKKNPEDISADSNSNISFDKYIIKILNDSFPYLKTQPSLFTDKAYIYAKDMPMQRREKTGPSDWIFGIILLILFIVAILLRYASSSIFEFIKGCFSKQQICITVKDGSIINYLSLIPILLIFIPIVSLFLYIILKFYSIDVLIPYKGYLLYVIIIASWIILYFLKILFIRFFGTVFRGKKISVFYIQNQLNFNSLMGFLLIIPMILLLYFDNYYQEIFIFIFLFLFGILYVIKLFRCFYLIINTFKFSSIYLFFYLCTIELLPILLIGKVLFFR